MDMAIQHRAWSMDVVNYARIVKNKKGDYRGVCKNR